MIPPGSFFPVAERYNLMPEIDRWVVRNLIKWIVKKRRRDPAWQMPLYCVNLAGASLSDPEFALYVQRELQNHNGVHLCFEIAESDMLDQRAAVLAFSTVMRPLGCFFTLDNFGAVRGSFASIAGLDFDFLKIDGAMIQNILSLPGDIDRVRRDCLVVAKDGYAHHRRVCGERRRAGETSRDRRRLCAGFRRQHAGADQMILS